MFSIPKRYLRIITYLLATISIILLIIRYRSISSINNLKFNILKFTTTENQDTVGWTKDQIILLLSTNNITLDSITNIDEIDFDIPIVTKVGIEECYHVAKIYESCYIKSQFDSLTSESDNSALKIQINKDIKGSFGFNWFGHSEYIFYEITTLGSLLQSQVKSLDLLTAVSININSKDDMVFNAYGLQFNFKKIVVKNLIDVYNKPTVINNINLLFGNDCKDPRFHWHLLKDIPFTQNEYRNPSYVSYERKSFIKEQLVAQPELLFDPQGQETFKIVQLADLHMGVGENECRDEFPATENCHADPKTLTFIESVLDIEAPDFVVFTGDQIMGDRAIQDSESTLLKLLDPIIQRQIPWAMVWGNHDDEGSMSRWELSELAANLPYSVFQFSPMDTQDNAFGVGNYVHQVFNMTQSQNDPLMTFYFLDSHKYSKNSKLSAGYDWIKEKQWQYMEQLYENNLSKHISVNKPHVSMAFFHIPLPEYLDIDSKKTPGQQNELVGNLKEGVTAPKYNSGGLQILSKLGVQATACGHDHCNDYCLKDDSTNSPIWLCFGGATGEGGYAGYGGTERRIRTYEINPYNGNIYTWKRLNGSPDKVFDYQLL